MGKLDGQDPMSWEDLYLRGNGIDVCMWHSKSMGTYTLHINGSWPLVRDKIPCAWMGHSPRLPKNSHGKGPLGNGSFQEHEAWMGMSKLHMDTMKMIGHH